ncbi:MAG TPA: GMC family oxidoreductase N-terminal domain-containing protein, partial [Verrucomicrobiae bacterium]|nr:GMC family oxidoreductase N-terminal domain-containing protein [Verrucomicrobiae bacterium]
EGIAVDWPIRYKDIAPWYDYVEDFAGISGKPEGLPHLPDGRFLPPMEMNCIETYFSDQIRGHYTDRIVTIGRTANLSQAWKGRGPCQYRNLCDRGCPFSGYFSSNAATLPAAATTGNMTLLSDSIVIEVLFDEHTGKAGGVRVMNAHTHQVTDYFARIIFLNASAIATAAILLASVSRHVPTGLGNSSGQIGHNLMDHFTGTGAIARFDGFPDQYYSGRRPTPIYIPRFRNLPSGEQQKDFIRGYGFQGSGSRLDWQEKLLTGDFGVSFKQQLTHPGPWMMWLGAWGETLPYYDNKITLDKEKKDRWGQPLVRIAFEYHDNEKAMQQDIRNTAVDMLEKAGFKDIHPYFHLAPAGSAVHEMGTVRMGR